jgi:hypothetical protein
VVHVRADAERQAVTMRRSYSRAARQDIATVELLAYRESI